MRTPSSPTWWNTGIAATLVLAAAAASGACWAHETEPVTTTPPDPAVRERIRAHQAGDARQLSTMMGFKRADGQVFYLVNAPCCDRFNHLYDGDGRRICAPTGGFGGSGDGRCPAWVAELWQSLTRASLAARQPTAAQGFEPARTIAP